MGSRDGVNVGKLDKPNMYPNGVDLGWSQEYQLNLGHKDDFYKSSFLR